MKKKPELSEEQKNERDMLTLKYESDIETLKVKPAIAERMKRIEIFKPLRTALYYKEHAPVT